MYKSISKLRNLLTTPVSKSFGLPTQFWFFLSMALATTYSFMALQKAFASDYVVEDDQRIFVSWLQQFLDPELLPNDIMAEYVQSVTPSGYTAFFWVMTRLGIEPLLSSKLLLFIIPFIGSIYIFFICLEILPVPIAGFMATVMLNQNLWMNGILSSTPRGFVYALLPAFIYYLLRRSLIPYLILIVLQGLFYPPYVFIIAGILLLSFIRWQDGRFSISREKNDLVFYGLGLGLVIVVMLPYVFSPSNFGPIVTLAQAKLMPEFAQQGRSPFFNENPIEFYFFGWQSGMFAGGPFKPPRLIWAALLLPVLLRFPAQFPLAKQVRHSVFILPQLLAVSLGMFVTAHVLFLRLYFPNRYIVHTLRMILVLADAIALTIVLDTILQWASSASSRWKPVLAMGVTLSLLLSLILLPVYLNTRGFNFPRVSYIEAREKSLYSFLTEQPKNTLTASLVSEVDNLPTFAKRPILVGMEYANPYHLGYYRQIKQRAIDLIHAQYSSNLEDVKQFIQKYGVDYFLIHQQAFTTKYVNRNQWFQQWQDLATEVKRNLEQGKIPVIAKLPDRCTVLRTNSLLLIQADCITKLSQ